MLTEPIELPFVMASDLTSNMTLKCRCKIFKRKYSCCYQFEPVEINDMRDCFLRDNWEHGKNLLNDIVLGALSSCVHSSAKQTKNQKRTNNHATLRLKGKRVCKDMFIFAYNNKKTKKKKET